MFFGFRFIAYLGFLFRGLKTLADCFYIGDLKRKWDPEV